MRKFGTIGVLLLASAPLYAQDEIARKQAVEVAVRVPFERAVKGAPYSAETIVEGNQTLADGNRIARKSTGRVYRDGEGRTRREEDRPNGTVGISIVDPVAGFSYSLDPVNKIAWKTAVGAAGIVVGKIDAAMADAQKMEERRKMEMEDRRKAEMEGAAAGAGGRGTIVTGNRVEPGAGVMMRSGGEPYKTPDNRIEGPLERKTIEGIAVEGRKNTSLIPAGEIGNEQPIRITSEEWTSPELKVLVMTHHSDPRMGESSYRLTNIIRAEPDRSLFMVPPDYTVKETGIRRMLESSRR